MVSVDILEEQEIFFKENIEGLLQKYAGGMYSIELVLLINANITKAMNS